MKRLLCLLAAFVLTATAPSFAAEVKLGYISDFTGIGLFFGEQSRRGATLAAEDLPSVKLVFEDVAGKVPNAVSAAQKLLNIDKVDALRHQLAGRGA